MDARFTITTEPLTRFVTVYVGSPMLTLSEAEHGVYHDRRVSDALHRHRIFDTTPMSTHPLLPLTSYLLPLTSYLSTHPLDGMLASAAVS